MAPLIVTSSSKINFVSNCIFYSMSIPVILLNGCEVVKLIELLIVKILLLQFKVKFVQNQMLLNTIRAVIVLLFQRDRCPITIDVSINI